MKSLPDLFTRDNITLVLAILGSVLSVGSLIANALSRRVGISISLSEYSTYHPQKIVQMYVMIANRSRLPVAITRLQILVDNQMYDCCSFPVKVKDFAVISNGQRSIERTFYTLPMPIHLDSLGSTFGYVQFSRPKGTFPLAPKEVTLKISTNRGRKLTLSIEVPPDGVRP